MDWENYLYSNEEKPLDRLVDKYSHTSIFRRIAFVGDSLSSGEFEIINEKGEAEYYDRFEYSFGQFISRANGITAYNFSRGGMTASRYLKGYADDHGFWDKEKAAQAYVVALGANDLVFAKQEIGSIKDINPYDPAKNGDSFIGDYAAIVQRYKEISPDAKFFFVTFARNCHKHFEEKAVPHREAMYALAEYFDNAYVIDLYKYGPAHNEKFHENFFMNGHMNPMGYNFTARLIDSYIDYIVRKKPKDFETVGFINYTNVKGEKI